MTKTPLVWDDGVPRSSLFGDIYYSLDDGLAESRAVFLAGCGLPEAWRGRQDFVVGELGFGTGLNIAALLKLWRETHAPGARLHIFSIEAFPPSREDAARALGAWPELADETKALLAGWPGGRTGFHRIDLPGYDAVLDLVILPVEEALAQWTGQADAWFLDGFSPALNPAMWTEAILAQVAARSRPGAVAATFTVARAVRLGLEAAGFTIAKRPGHGRKRERLEARLSGTFTDLQPGRVAIIGAGIAGASLARALRAEGVAAAVFADGPPAASGNPVAMVTPALDASGGARAALYAQAFARAVELYQALPDAVLSRGAVQHPVTDRDSQRFATVAAQDLFDPERLVVTDEGLRFEDGLVVRPAEIIAEWAGRMAETSVERLDQEGERWRISLADGDEAVFDTVIVAAGWGSARLAPHLALQPVRGQANWAHGPTLKIATAFSAYALPMEDGVLFGATHDRGSAETDVRKQDNDRNLAALAQGLPHLAAELAGQVIEGRAAVRVATADRLPVAGQIAPGLWALTALGSRGFTTAPLLAEHLAAEILGRPSPLPARLIALISPNREQALRRPS
jgi:tRNA 5-methylaminomethyl-2-thiouridine biosynthesis bifunctional protein